MKDKQTLVPIVMGAIDKDFPLMSVSDDWMFLLSPPSASWRLL